MDATTNEPFGPSVHNIEVYTSRLIVQGTVTGQFKRLSDLMNRRDLEALAVRDASITPLGQPTSPVRLKTPVIVGRARIHFVSVAQQPNAGATPEYVVQKTHIPCYAFTSNFIIFGYCHLLKEASLEHLLEMPNSFIPFTNATIYMASNPTAPWRREVVIVNKEQLEAIYEAGD